MNVSKQTEIPVIEGIYDPLSLRRDGTITPCAPVLISGYNLLCWPKDKSRFFLCPADEPDHMFPVLGVYKHTEEQLLITLPDIKKGYYHLALQLEGEGGLKEMVYHFPVNWQVKAVTVMEIFRERQIYYV